MAWDSSRPVPWRRLIKDWILYFAIMAVVYVFLLHDRVSAGTTMGLVASGPLFIALGAVLAKFGYTRKTLKELRAMPREPAPARTERTSSPTSSSRNRPPATKRTSTGPRNRPTSKRKR
ncbi:MAG: hypothetical protein JWN99_2813 [Ilumatobacteraceae bacterium]|nr:hypothetical protein [Ilumatobacteraceae bacterium]